MVLYIIFTLFTIWACKLSSIFLKGKLYVKSNYSHWCKCDLDVQVLVLQGFHVTVRCGLVLSHSSKFTVYFTLYNTGTVEIKKCGICINFL